ncbi:hypothetical protein AMECASPLE_027752 [Ameca splendens]|uniref:Uncharacterized protein n=1 Tax=Ameca splendens TaxID=208324 RepID=A0ABV1ABK8_9TELE
MTVKDTHTHRKRGKHRCTVKPSCTSCLQCPQKMLTAARFVRSSDSTLSSHVASGFQDSRTAGVDSSTFEPHLVSRHPPQTPFPSPPTTPLESHLFLHFQPHPSLAPHRPGQEASEESGQDER